MVFWKITEDLNPFCSERKRQNSPQIPAIAILRNVRPKSMNVFFSLSWFWAKFPHSWTGLINPCYSRKCWRNRRIFFPCFKIQRNALNPLEHYPCCSVRSPRTPNLRNTPGIDSRHGVGYTLSHSENNRDVSAYSTQRRLSSRAQLVCFLMRSKRNTGIDA